MTDTEYADWTEHHRTLFWMRSEEDTALFVAWKPLLRGYGLAECTAASNWLAVHDSARFRTEHLRALNNFIRAAREEAARRQLAAEQSSEPDCPACGGSGVVSVPHFRFVSDGEWKRHGNSYPTMAVTCSCPRGQRLQSKHVEGTIARGKPGLPSLGWYEGRVPHWAELLCERDNARKDELAALEHASHADRRRGPVDVAGIKDRLARVMDARRGV